MLCTELHHNLVSLGQVRAGHRWEEVVLNLVVQAAHEVVLEPAAADVAAGENLTLEEVDLRAFLDQRHSLVVRRKSRTHEETEDEHHEDPEGNGPEPTEHQCHQNVRRGLSHGHEAKLEQANLDRPVLALQAREAVEEQVKTSEQQKQREQVALTIAQPALKTAFAVAALNGEAQDTDIDVRVFIDEIWLLVVFVVLALPEAVAESGEEVGENQPHPVVCLVVAEYLAVCGLVGNKAELSTEDAEQTCDGEPKKNPRAVLVGEQPHKPAGHPQGRGKGRDNCKSDDVEGGLLFK